MVRHLVLWRFLEFTSDGNHKQNLNTALKMLSEMQDKIEGIIDFKAGINLIAGSNKSDLALSILFTDWEALKNYQSHAAHLKVKDFLCNVRYERRVVDYEITPK